MASKWQTCRLSETQDRRVKLTKAKKEEITRKFETGEYSLRGLAREYNVSHKTISLIVDQRAKQKKRRIQQNTLDVLSSGCRNNAGSAPKVKRI